MYLFCTYYEQVSELSALSKWLLEPNAHPLPPASLRTALRAAPSTSPQVRLILTLTLTLTPTLTLILTLTLTLALALALALTLHLAAARAARARLRRVGWYRAGRAARPVH